MADGADQASELEQLALRIAIANAASGKGQPKITPNGACHNCEEPLKGGKLFCDKDCEQDWRHRIERKK